MAYYLKRVAHFQLAYFISNLTEKSDTHSQEDAEYRPDNHPATRICLSPYKK